MPSQNFRESTEQTTLLPQPNHQGQPSTSNAMSFSLSSILRRRAHPYWLIPVVLVMSISRGVTMAPRIQVYRALACRSLSSDTGLGLAALAGAVDCEGPDIEAKLAKIQAAVVTTMSVLSAITTGFWSRSGDVRGRKPILSTFLIGALLMEAVFMLVMRPQSAFGRHGEKLILVGPVLEGLVGGLSTFNGVVHAYISDCTRHGSRSKIFSTVQGMVFVGLAIGPQIAGFFLPKTGYSDSFFLTSIGLIIFTLLYVIFVCPESLDPVEAVVADTTRDDRLQFKTSPILAARSTISRILSSLLSPILMFAPRRVPNSRRWNYSMTLVGLALFSYIVSTGVYSAKYYYARYVFKWDTAELGYYMSILWITRAFNLLVFLPILISYFKPKPTSVPGGTPNAHDIAAEIKFDRYLAQISVGVDGVADSLVALTASRSQPIFVALSCLSSFTSGGNPALHSLGAICLHACGFSSEVGAMFGAMGVLSAVSHIISPYVYALTYSRRVGSFPEVIFVLAASLLFSAVFFLAWVQPSESEIANVHNGANNGGSRRRSVDEGGSQRHHLSGSYDYDAVPTYEDGRPEFEEQEEQDLVRVVTKNPQSGTT